MQFIIYLPLMALALFIGHYTGGGNQETDEVVDIEEIKQNAIKREELFNAMAKATTRVPASVASVRENLPTPKDQEILKLIDRNDPLQVILGDMMISGRQGKNDPVANAELRNKLKSNPTKGFKAIKGLFERLSFEDYPVEKAALMALATETEIGKPEEMKELALDSLMKDVAPARLDPRKAVTEEEKNLAFSTTDKMFLPTISYETYLKTSPDPETAVTETLKILQTQEDHAVRNSIVNSFNQKYPGHDKELEALANEHKVSVLVYQEREQAQAFAQKEEQLAQEYQAKLQDGSIQPEGSEQ